MGYEHQLNPVAFSLFGFDVYYYGLSYVLGILFVLWYLRWSIQKKRLALPPSAIWDVGIYGMIGLLVGARFGYILFYEPLFYISHPWAMIALWEGGMSFHGGLIGLILSFWLFCRKFQISFYALADTLVIPLSLALAFGRIANFMNAELYGKITTVPWGVIFPGDDRVRHPSQLYEAGKNIGIFLILIYLSHRERLTGKEGGLFWTFIFLYGILRFVIEFWREPEIMIGVLSMGQGLSLCMVIIGGLFLFYRYFYESS